MSAPTHRNVTNNDLVIVVGLCFSDDRLVVVLPNSGNGSAVFTFKTDLVPL